MSSRLRFVLVSALSLIGVPALGQATLVPEDGCLAIEHFPDQPVGNAPSKAVLYITLPPAWGGGTIIVQYSGASDNQSGEGTVAPDGLAMAELPLSSFGPHQIDQVVVSNSDGSPAPVDPAALPNGGAFTVDESEPQCDPDSLARVVVATTTTSTTTNTTTSTTAEPTTTQPPTTTFLVESPSSTTIPEGNLVPWLFIVVGLGLAVVGLWLLRKKSCDELYRLWQAAQDRYETCAEELLKAQRWLEEKRAERLRHEQELAELEKSAATGSITQGGATFQNLPGRGLVTAEGMTDIIGSVRAQIESGRQAEQIGEEMVDNWRRKMEEATAQADSARRAYEDCIGATTSDQTGATQAPPVAGPAGPAIATSPTASQLGCPAGDRRAVPLSESRTFRVYRAFRIETETEGEAAAGETGTQLAADLDRLGAELGFLGALLGAGGAGARIAEGVVTASAGAVTRGGAEGYATAKGNLGSSTFPIPVPTSPQEVLVGLLQLIAQLAGTVAGKVSEWTQRRAFRSYRLVKEYRTITVQPFRIEECDGWTYRCVEQVRQYTIGGTGTERGQLRDAGMGVSENERAAQERQLRILISQGKQSVERSVKAMMDYEAQHPIGPCE